MSDPAGPSLAARLHPKLYRLALFFCALFLFLGCCRPLMDNVDMGWHVAQGRWMFQHGAIYRQDALTYPNWHHPLVNEYPLFQAVVYPAWKLGWWGLFILTAGAYLLLLGVLIRAGRRWLPEGAAPFVIALALMLIEFHVAFPLRPHLATYLCTGLLGVFLLRHRDAVTLKEFWPLFPLQVAWTNCHSAFVLGPIMVGLFGLEMTLRRTIELRRVAWPLAGRWGLVFLGVLLACLINPFGIDRFYPPIYQGELESIRAYVGEMQPLTGVASSLFAVMAILAALCVAVAAFRRGGVISFSFLFLAFLFYYESLSVSKSWPVFGLFPPLLVLSSGAFRPPRRAVPVASWGGVAGNLFAAVALLFGSFLLLDPGFPVSLPAVWRQYALDRRELPYSAVAWMRSQRIEGRFLHRSEDGGLLQEKGYDQGQTFSDTGFGKYDERLIHLVCMIGDRPALLPLYREAFRPDYVVCNSLCFRWPYYLRQSGWRMIFYSTTGAVWTRPETRPDLPSVSSVAMEASYLNDIARNGLPTSPLLEGRNLLALNSAGSEDFAFAQLTGLPAATHHLPWYWEAARIFCFETPRLSAAHRASLVREADAFGDDQLTAEFRAFARFETGDPASARKILESASRSAIGSHGNNLLLKIMLEEHDPAALLEAESSANFDLRDGEHWALVAQAEDAAGHVSAAATAWKKAVFFYPDEPDIIQGAKSFAQKHHDEALAQIAARGPDLPLP